MTTPLQIVKRLLPKGPYVRLRQLISNTARSAWAGLPLPITAKLRLKHALFRDFPGLFRWSLAYRSWASLNRPHDLPPLPAVDPAKAPPQQPATDPFVPLLHRVPPPSIPVRLIAFYLPQFHAIAENNAWWGNGFTEWTNVLPAKPQFEGHYQPHQPGELGAYDLLNTQVQKRQIELAKIHGVGAFCFYTYWFAGKLLLEKPVENYLADPDLDLPFCLCWANENWSRRWDGLDHEILIAQQHSAADDIAFITHVSRYLKDPRYVRIDGKPLLVVYRPALLPSALQTAKRWRTWCKENGVGEVYLAYTQSFEAVDPATYGFDAAIEFPPNNTAPPNVTSSVEPSTPQFASTVYDWRVFVERSRHYKAPPYKLFRGVCPSWDNTARRKHIGTVFLHSNPSGYEEWLRNAVNYTCTSMPNPQERLVFVNAWNEWAEGAHLEPDMRYGYAYLQATRNALSDDKNRQDAGRRIVLVAHDGHPHGAQLLALNLARTLSQGMGFAVELVCLGDGPLKAQYAKWATLHDLTGVDPRGPEAQQLARTLYADGVRAALVNTTVSGYFLETLTGAGIACVALIHELRGVLELFGLHGQAAAIAACASKVVFPAVEVAASFNQVAAVPGAKAVIRPQGLYKRRTRRDIQIADTRLRLRRRLGLPPQARIVLGVGYADQRKGIDLFVESGLALAQREPDAHWVWVGHWEQQMQRLVEQRLMAAPDLRAHFHFPGLQADTDDFFGGADVFALTSREDPFPSVVLEAMDSAVPIVAFQGAGGFVELIRDGCGILVPKEDATAFAIAVGNILASTELQQAFGRRGAELIQARFSFRHYVFDLLDLMGMGLDRISVVVPNFNYSRYLAERLQSIIGQSHPPFEIIFLDDCSTDDSLAIAQPLLEASGIDFKIVRNAENSHSVFRQWKKGLDLAAGNKVWIAEADDACDAVFLTEVVKGFKADGTVLSYCDSQQVADDGMVMARSYLDYVRGVHPTQWLHPYCREGVQEITASLSVKNTIPNVSAVLFDTDTVRSIVREHLELICSYRVAGDWLTYVLVLERGKMAYLPAALNRHRRHGRGVTLRNLNDLQLEEIQRMQRFVAGRHPVPADKCLAASQYLEELRQQFASVAD